MKLNDIIDNPQKYKGISCIYSWTNIENNKIYIGQTQNLYYRMKQYERLEGKRYIMTALRKYGVDKFELNIIEEIPISNLDEREQYWIDFYKSYLKDFGYNICRFANTTRGFHHSEETKARLRTMKLANPVRLFGQQNGMYGKAHSKECLAKLSAQMKEKWQDENYRQFWTNKMSGENNYFYDKHLYGELNGMYGKHHSEETKQKISAKNKGRKSKCSIRIICIETNQEFESYTEAAKYLNTYASAIKLAVDNPERTCRGYHFKKI